MTGAVIARLVQIRLLHVPSLRRANLPVLAVSRSGGHAAVVRPIAAQVAALVFKVTGAVILNLVRYPQQDVHLSPTLPVTQGPVGV